MSSSVPSPECAAAIAVIPNPARVAKDVQLLSVVEVCAVCQTRPASSTPKISMRPSVSAVALRARSFAATEKCVHVLQVFAPGEVCER